MLLAVNSERRRSARYPGTERAVARTRDASSPNSQAKAHKREVIGYRTGVTVVESFLVLAGIPAAIFGLLALMTLWPKFARSRKRRGQEWDFAPVFWVANPAEVSSAPPEDLTVEGESEENSQPSTARGGARGNW